MLQSFPTPTADPFHALRAALDTARRTYLDALNACDQAVRRGDDTALDTLLQDATVCLAALQTLSQQWLRQAAQQGLWAVTVPASRAVLTNPHHATNVR